MGLGCGLGLGSGLGWGQGQSREAGEDRAQPLSFLGGNEALQLARLRELLLHLLAAHQLVLDARRLVTVGARIRLAFGFGFGFRFGWRLDRVRALEQQPRLPLPVGRVVVR